MDYQCLPTLKTLFTFSKPGFGSPAVCRFKFTESLREVYTNSNSESQENMYMQKLHTSADILHVCIHKHGPHNVVRQITLKFHHE